MATTEKFTTKYAPQDLKNFVLPNRIKDQFKDGLYGDHLFHGTPGIGKSQLAKVLLKKHPYKYINASLDGRIDMIRDELRMFCTRTQLNDNPDKTGIKYVWFDELDKASDAFFDALRGFMDTYGEVVRFVGTCNYINKVPPAIKSRFDLESFNFTGKEADFVKALYTKRMYAIVTRSLGMKISDDAMGYLVNNNYPDFRGILQQIQGFHQAGLEEITMENVSQANFTHLELYQLLCDCKIEQQNLIQTVLEKYPGEYDEIILSLGKNLCAYITEKRPTHYKVIPHLLIGSAKYSNMLATSPDRETIMLGCVANAYIVLRQSSQK